MSVDTHNFNPCIVIPCYNHGAMIPGVMARLSHFALPVIIVDDGSDAPTRSILENLLSDYPQLTLCRLAQNAGKGAAVIKGLNIALDQGYSHAVQVDADGQHAIEDIPHMLALAKQHPNCLVSGQPIYDSSIPKSRLYGRWITHFWVWVETLSFSLKDSMCGFRVYPVLPTLQLARQTPPGQRMDFDTEVMVRLYWQGINSLFLPTRVTYPKDGLSHFDALKDNCRISWMHTRLVFGMLPRIPSLLIRRQQQHWAQKAEVNGLAGMRIMLFIWRLLGRNAFTLLLWPVIACYWLFAREGRQASRQWLQRVQAYCLANGRPVPPGLNSYRHFLRFGNAMLDKVASWRGELHLGKDVCFAPGAEAALDADSHKGRIIIASHLGDVEVCRALAQRDKHIVINALVFTENAQRFKKIMEEMAPQSGIYLMPVTNMGPETAILLQDKLNRGEWIAIVGDRIAVHPQRGGDWRVIWSQFLGRPAPFPQGPFILAAALRCPVLLFFALKQQGKLHIYCESFADPLLLPRASRQHALQQAVDSYARRLEHFALQSPLDWFNFYDFWQLPSTKSGPEKEDKE